MDDRLKLWFILFNLSLLLEVVAVFVATPGHCSVTHYKSDCAQKMSGSLIAIIFLAPMLVSVVIKTLPSNLVLSMWVFDFACVVLAAALKFHDASTIIVALAPMCLIILWEYHRQKLSMYLLTQELQGVESRNERLEIEVKANELKHLIGNVAHDLKTVSNTTEVLLLKCQSY